MSTRQGVGNYLQWQDGKMVVDQGVNRYMTWNKGNDYDSTVPYVTCPYCQVGYYLIPRFWLLSIDHSLQSLDNCLSWDSMGQSSSVNIMFILKLTQNYLFFYLLSIY
jgi:hypothetical protein